MKLLIAQDRGEDASVEQDNVLRLRHLRNRRLPSTASAAIVHRRAANGTVMCVLLRPTVTAGDRLWYGVAKPKLGLVVRPGNLNAQLYQNIVLRSVVVPFIGGNNNNLFQHDNARPHVSRATQQYLHYLRQFTTFFYHSMIY